MMTDSDGCKLEKDNRIVAIGICKHKMFSMVLKTRSGQVAEQANIAVISKINALFLLFDLRHHFFRT